MPGRLLHAIAQLVFDDAVRRTVVDQAIADMREEWVIASANSRERLRARLRGYAAFWSLVAISPVAFHRWPGREKNGRPLGRFASVVAAIVLLVLARRTNMDYGLSAALDQLPQGTLGVLGAGADYAFLIAPAILAIMLIRRWRGGSELFRIHAGEVVMAGLASITGAIFLGTAGIIHTFQQIGLQGSAGVGTVTAGVVGATQPLVLAVGSAAICLVAFATVTLFRHSRHASKEEAARPSLRWAFGWSALLVGTLVAVDQLFRLHHEMTNFLVILLGPPSGASGRVLAAQSEQIIPPLLTLGFLLSIVIVALTIAMWRASRARHAHPLMTWASSVALVAVVIGGAWHAQVVRTDLQTYHDNMNRMRAQVSPR